MTIRCVTCTEAVLQQNKKSDISPISPKRFDVCGSTQATNHPLTRRGELIKQARHTRRQQ